MQSRVSFKGHPTHPALIPFPFAFLWGTVGFDLAGSLLQSPSLWVTGAHLAAVGVVAGLVAAVPGLIDYLTTVHPGAPENSERPTMGWRISPR